MTMSTREAFERGTDTFNAHDIDGFAEVLADEVAFEAPGGMRGEGKEACAGFYGSWFAAFPDAHVDVHSVHIIDDVAVEDGVTAPTTSQPRGTSHRRDVLSRWTTSKYSASRDGKHASFHLIFDRLEMLEQLGLIRAPPTASASAVARAEGEGGSPGA